MEQTGTDPSILLAKIQPNPQGKRRKVTIKNVMHSEPGEMREFGALSHTLFLPHLKHGIGRDGTGLLPNLMPGGRTQPQ